MAAKLFTSGSSILEESTLKLIYEDKFFTKGWEYLNTHRSASAPWSWEKIRGLGQKTPTAGLLNAFKFIDETFLKPFESTEGGASDAPAPLPRYKISALWKQAKETLRNARRKAKALRALRPRRSLASAQLAPATARRGSAPAASNSAPRG